MRYLTRRARTAAKVAVPTAVAGALLALPAVAGATEVTPAGADYTATAGDTVFIDANGTSTNDVTCSESEATGSVPPAGTTNNNELDNGSVNGPVHSLTFGGTCSALSGAVGATVDTEFGDGGYTLTALALAGNPDHAVAAFNIPDDKIQIDIGPGLCEITIPNNGDDNDMDPPEDPNPVAASAMGPFDNGTDNDTDPSELSITSQLPFVDTCGGLVPLETPGVFWADGGTHDGINTTVYTVENDVVTDPPIQINPSP